MNWLQAPAQAAGLGLLLVGIATLVLVTTAVGLGVASVWMQPARGKRALRVVKELRLLIAALRGARAPVSPGTRGRN